GIEPIRLVELLPSFTSRSPIECRLIEVDLSQKPDYEALSYVWGDPSRTIAICVDYCKMEVTENLWSALFRLRLKRKPKVIWADALCIDQQSTDDKRRQVQIMRDVYKTASQVIIWLGEHTDSSEILHCAKELQTDEELAQMNASCEQPSQIAALSHLLQRPWFSRTW
ncbi:hypothetical protein BO94DRAFT_440595, partial [Aspergillus sclerotioniger CBS 115572]